MDVPGRVRHHDVELPQNFQAQLPQVPVYPLRVYFLGVFLLAVGVGVLPLKFLELVVDKFAVRVSAGVKELAVAFCDVGVGLDDLCEVGFIAGDNFALVAVAFFLEEIGYRIGSSR